MRKFITDCLTGKDNRTFDAARILWALGGVAFILYAGWDVFRTSHFAAQDFGIGFGGILSGGGAGVGLKAKTEPEPQQQQQQQQAEDNS
jgi:hypothetical protein